MRSGDLGTHWAEGKAAYGAASEAIKQFPAHVQDFAFQVALLYGGGKAAELLAGTVIKVGGNLYRYIRSEKKLVKVVNGRAVALEKRELDTISMELRVLGQRTCFVAGTPLLTPTGERPIEQFRRGDLILSRPEHSPESPPEIKVVQETFVRTSTVINLRIGGRLIRTTGEHPFYVKGKGWMPAKEIQPGEELSSHDGRWTPVEGVEDAHEVATVYNLSVGDHHTYFVGSRDWGFSVWAHNAEYVIVKLKGTDQVTIVDSEGNVVLAVIVDLATFALVGR
jgi:hypothetical protein